MILYIIKQSNRIAVKQRIIDKNGNTREVDAPDEVPANEVVMLQPYGSLFFASAPIFEEALPAVTSETTNSVVILRLRGRDDLGSTFTDVLLRYAETLDDAVSKLVIVADSPNVHEQLAVARVTNAVGEQNIYASSKWVGETAGQAYDDAEAWIEARARDPEKDSESDQSDEGDPTTESGKSSEGSAHDDDNR